MEYFVIIPMEQGYEFNLHADFDLNSYDERQIINDAITSHTYDCRKLLKKQIINQNPDVYDVYFDEYDDNPVLCIQTETLPVNLKGINKSFSSSFDDYVDIQTRSTSPSAWEPEEPETFKYDLEVYFDIDIEHARLEDGDGNIIELEDGQQIITEDLNNSKSLKEDMNNIEPNINKVKELTDELKEELLVLSSRAEEYNYGYIYHDCDNFIESIDDFIGDLLSDYEETQEEIH